MAIKKNKGYSAKKRNSYNRERNRFIVIVAEGNNKTEKLYFKRFKSDFITVKYVSGGATDPANMTKNLLSYCKKVDFDSSLGDKSYCFVDADVNPQKNIQISEADIIAADNPKYNIKIIVSNPCFEEWYMCHFGYSTKQYVSSAELIKDIQNKIPGYTKSQEGVYDLLKSKFDDAIKNAKKLEDYNIKSGRKPHTSDFQPSTEVYKVFEAINEKE